MLIHSVREKIKFEKVVHEKFCRTLCKKNLTLCEKTIKVVECSERTVLPRLEPVCLCW